MKPVRTLRTTCSQSLGVCMDVIERQPVERETARALGRVVAADAIAIEHGARVGTRRAALEQHAEPDERGRQQPACNDETRRGRTAAQNSMLKPSWYCRPHSL